jgi:murein DD-endopeptidase MepM/ murein hydrolase activator NlpD
MPSKRTILLPLSLLAIVFVVGVAAAPRAQATPDEPPFVIRFPQEISSTQFDNSFGARRSGGRRHEGNDLMAPKMTEVYAIADGVVETVDKGRSAGRYLIISHEGGWSSSYMHLNNDSPGTDNGEALESDTFAPGIAEGAMVHAGDLIGYVGDSGNAEWTGSHTHFELSFEGKVVDPYDLLQDAWSRDYRRHVRDIWRVSGPLGLELMI